MLQHVLREYMKFNLDNNDYITAYILSILIGSNDITPEQLSSKFSQFVINCFDKCKLDDNLSSYYSNVYIDLQNR